MILKDAGRNYFKKKSIFFGTYDDHHKPFRGLNELLQAYHSQMPISDYPASTAAKGVLPSA